MKSLFENLSSWISFSDSLIHNEGSRSPSNPGIADFRPLQLSTQNNDDSKRRRMSIEGVKRALFDEKDADNTQSEETDEETGETDDDTEETSEHENSSRRFR